MFRLALFALFCFASQAALAGDAPPTEAQLLAWLRELEPLPKPHYSWPLNVNSHPDELMFEYVRITHAVSLRGEGHYANRQDVTPAVIDKAVELCGRVNAGKPQIRASLGVNYSVWHRRFGKDLPPTDVGPTHAAELELLRQKLTRIRDELARANDRHGSDVAVTAVLFDSERFHVQRDDEEWNAAITAKYDAAYDVAREIFPSVRIEWYARGAVHPSASNTGWSSSRLFTLDEKGESFGCSLYHVPEIGITRETFRRTCQLAREHGVDEVTPWVALASGYRRQTDEFHEWSIDWNYDLIYSWKLGAEINHPWFGQPERQQRFAPWNSAKLAIFYPEPFGRSPHWGRHFVAYVRGAHLIRTLPTGEAADESSR